MAYYVLDITALYTVQWTLADWELTEWTFWSPPQEMVPELHTRFGWDRTKNHVDGTVGQLHGIAHLQGQAPDGEQLQIRMLWWGMGFRFRANDDPHPEEGPVSIHAPMAWQPLMLDMAYKRDAARLRRMNDGAEVPVIDFQGMLDQKRKDEAVQSVARGAESVWPTLLASLPLPPFPGQTYPGRHTGAIAASR